MPELTDSGTDDYNHQVDESKIQLKNIGTQLVKFSSQNEEEFHALIEIYINIAAMYRSSGYSDESYVLLSTLRYAMIEADKDICLNTAIIYLHLGEFFCDEYSYDAAIMNYNKAIEIFEAFPTKHDFIVDAYTNISYAYFMQNNFDMAKKYLLDVVKQNRNSDFIDSLYRELSQICSEIGEYDSAIKYGKKALEYKDKKDELISPERAFVCSHLSAILMEKNQLLEALNINSKIYGNVHFEIYANYTFLIGIYSKLGDYDKGINTSHELVEVAESLFDDDDFYKANAYSTLASIYLEVYEYDKSLSYYKKALTVLNTMEANNRQHDYSEMLKASIDQKIDMIGNMLK